MRQAVAVIGAGAIGGLVGARLHDAGIDVLVVTSKHNIQYLLGGYRFFFFDHFDAIGISRLRHSTPRSVDGCAATSTTSA